MVRARTVVIAGILACSVAVAGQRPAADTPPAWAYPANPPDLKPAPDDGKPRTVPGSSASFTLKQIGDLFSPPDWHPGDHPPMPEVVGKGRRPNVYACGYCHLPTGQGKAENANLTGLPAAYIKQQMQDYKNGLRVSSAPNLVPQALMTGTAKAVSEADIDAAAAYFSSLPPKRGWIRVIETKTVPKTHVDGWVLVPIPGSKEMEPIGQRIIETPEDVSRTKLRDFRSGFIAYVPVGSLKRGESLVNGGGGRTIACATCHGAGLKGLGPVPGLAGRSPIYIFRQLYDFKRGTRNGVWADLMDAAIAKLTDDDFVALAAYAASLTP